MKQPAAVYVEQVYPVWGFCTFGDWHLMAGDALKKVQSGQRLEIIAEAYNGFLDAAVW